MLGTVEAPDLRAAERTATERFMLTEQQRQRLALNALMAIDPSVLKMKLRKALGVIKGLRRHVSDADEDVIVHKLLEKLDVAGYEIVKKPSNAGFTFDTPGGDGAV